MRGLFFTLCGAVWLATTPAILALAQEDVAPAQLQQRVVQPWIPAAAVPDLRWRDLDYSPTLQRFAAVSMTGEGARVMTSDDGETWTLRDTPADNDWQGVTWVDDLDMFIAVAQSGDRDQVMTSPDGEGWTLQRTPSNQKWQSVAWSPDHHLLVAVAEYLEPGEDRVMTSPDGENWTVRPDTGDASWRRVIYANEADMFVAVGNSIASSSAMYSLDGTTWNRIETPEPRQGWGAVAWSPELARFVTIIENSAGNLSGSAHSR